MLILKRYMLRWLLLVLVLLAPPLRAEESCLSRLLVATCGADTGAGRCFRADDYWRVQLQAAFEMYPPLLQERLCQLDALAFDSDMASSGEAFLGREIRINTAPAMMGLTISEWATWKERLPLTQDRDMWFPAPGGLEVVAQVNGHEVPALVYILAHELGHVADAWLQATKPPTGPWAMPPVPAQLCYYHCTDRLPEAEIAPLYGVLSTSGFPSAYGTMGPEERFAEIFALYFLRAHIGLSWRVYWQGEEVFDAMQHLDDPALQAALTYMDGLAARLEQVGERPNDALMELLRGP